MPQIYNITESPVVQNEFGGCDVIIDVLNRLGFSDFIDYTLKCNGKVRSPRADYKFSEGILAWFFTLCCGGDCIEDMELNRERMFNHARFFELPPRYITGMSPDTFSKICSELVQPSIALMKKSYEVKKTKRKKKKRRGRPKKSEIKKIQMEKTGISTHQVCRNNILNSLLLKTALKLGLIKRNHKYVLDFDTSAFVSKISDCRKYYDGSGERAYCPAIASINDIPIFIENRNGDTPSNWNLTQTIAEIIDFLKNERVIIDTIRVDGAAYVAKFIEYSNQNDFDYVTRLPISRTAKEVDNVNEWHVAKLKGVEIELGEIEMEMRNTTNSHRVVIKHVLDDDKYWALITNIRDLSMLEICNLYTTRSGVNGAGEHVIQRLKGDFVCKYLPFRSLEKNTVFICISAICFCIYQFLVKIFSKNLKTFESKIHLDTFIDKFIKVKTHWKNGELFFDDEKRAAMYARLAEFT